MIIGMNLPRAIASKESDQSVAFQFDMVMYAMVRFHLLLCLRDMQLQSIARPVLTETAF
jgi:hypothetical protein